MARIIPIGNFSRFILSKLFIIGLIVAIGTTAAMAQTCQTGVSVPLVHAEGLAEQIGDITLSCTGGTSGSNILTYLYLTLNATITNALDKNGNLLGIVTTVDTGGGPVANGLQPTLNSPSELAVTGMSYTVPTPNTNTVTLRISGIRVAVPTVPNQGGNSVPAFVNGSLSGAGANIELGQSLLLAQPVATLLSSSINNGIPCMGSAAPANTPYTFQSFIGANASSSTVRLTEANAASFVTRDTSDPTVTNGMRFILNLSGYGASSQVYVPNAIVGSSGDVPTSGGAYGTTIGAGTYSPGQNELLLALVNGADATGAGGTLAFGIPASTTTFSNTTQVSLTNGAGYAVYEVLDENLNQVEWAQIPVFLVEPANTCTNSSLVALSSMVGPVSTVETPSVTAPITRYAATTPGNDCTAIGDCSGSYFPALSVTPLSVTLNGAALGAPVTGAIGVTDTGQSQMPFTVTTTYQTAAGLSSGNWLSIDGSNASTQSGAVDPVNGFSQISLNLSANSAALATPGTYKAKVAINAGEAGSVTVPVVFNVGAAGPVIQSIVNAANFAAGPVTIGSFASIFGLNLAKKNTLTVTFDGFPAQVSYDSPAGTANPTQINVLVPVGLGISQNAGVVVTVDGVVSNTFAISLTQNAPAVFTPGILNQNNSVNLAGTPASLGDVVQVFLTGLAIPTTGQVTVNIGSATGLIPYQNYAGAVASIPGLEQVNVQVPTGLTFSGGSAPLSICIPGRTGRRCARRRSAFIFNNERQR